MRPTLGWDRPQGGAPRDRHLETTNVTARCLRGLMSLALVGSLCGAAAAQEANFPRELHPWGRFPVGSWKRVRTTSQALDEKGQVLSESITDTRTTLTAVGPESYTLQTEVTVEVASRWITGLPQVTRHGFYGETPPQAVSVRRLADAPLTIDGRTVNCQVRQVVLANEGGKLVHTLYLAEQVPPFVLRRESSLENSHNEEKRRTALVEVVALDLPFRIGGELRSASLIKTTQYLARGTKTTFEIHCVEVPGGVAAHWATETNGAGRVIRRSTLELIDFSIPSGEEEEAVPGSFRRHRPGKTMRRVDGR